MSQKRIQDFGSPVTAKSLKTLSGSFSPAAVLLGNDFIVDGLDRIKITPGTCITDQGVIIIEDEAKFLTVANTSPPADYTVYYDHSDADISGGVSAQLTLASGLLTEDSVSGVILGYVRYPGGAIPLSPSHFIVRPKLQIGSVRATSTNANWLTPIKSQGFMTANAVAGPITITDVYDTGGPKPEMFVRIRNNTLANASISLIFPFKVKDLPYSFLEMVLSADINATLTASLVDSAGVVYVLTPTPLTGISSLILNNIVVSRDAAQTPNTLVYLQLQIALAASREIKLQAIGLNQFNSPI